MNTLKHTETIYQGSKIALELLTIDLPNGGTASKEVIRHPGAAVIIPRKADGTLVLIEQYRYAIGRTILEFPAGTLEEDEEPLACAMREIQEETGFAAGKWTEIGELYPAPGICDELQFLYLAEELRPGAGTPDEDEVIQTVELTLAEVDAAILSGRLCDAKSISAVYKAKLKGLL